MRYTEKGQAKSYYVLVGTEQLGSLKKPSKKISIPIYRTSSMPLQLPTRLSRLLQWRLPAISPLSNGVPLCKQQARNAHILATLSDNPSAYNKRIRRGRGPASGKGKTSGRGHGGQKQHGKVPAGFNGGQTPDHIVHGVRGADNNAYVAGYIFFSLLCTDDQHNL
jgi:ribosomal L18e/L15-like protein